MRRSMFLNEGTATRRDVFLAPGKVIKGNTYAAPLEVGDMVKIDSTIAEFTVTKSAAADVWNGSASGAVGYVVSEPWPDGYSIATDGGTAVFATASSRTGTIEFVRGAKIKDVVVVDAAQAGVVLGWTGSSMSIAGATTSGHHPAGVLLQSSSAGGTHSVLLFN